MDSVKKHRLSPLVILAIGLLFSVGCALTDVASSPENTPAAGSPTQAAPAATRAPGTTPSGSTPRNTPSSSAPRSPDSLLIPMEGGDPPTLDPAVAQDSTSAEIIVEVYSGLDEIAIARQPC